MEPNDVITLTPPQQRFADDCDATACMEASDHSGVFFYREEDGLANRWLVDAEGEVLDHTRFRRQTD